MKQFFRLVLLASLSVLIAGVVFAKTVTEFAPGQTVSIHLYNSAQVTTGVLHLAADDTGRLFRAARIQVGWECPSTESPEDRGTDMTIAAFQHPDTRGYIVVRVVRGTPTNVFPGALGYALPFAHTGAHVLIFYDRIQALTRDSSEPAYIILGHAMAHEIGHVLLHSSEHTIGGLMQARWTPETWRLASAGLLAFTAEQAERMRSGLQRYQIQPRYLAPAE